MLATIIAKLEPSHRALLTWAQENQGLLSRWPGLHPSGILLATKAKGIYKPAGWTYALSIRQTVGSPYPDEDPIFWPDGTWSYKYHQEGLGGLPTSDYTNRALVRCIEDQVPVIVFRQEVVGTRVMYRLLGVALVIGWESGLYSLEGFSREGKCAALGATMIGPVSLEDARERINRSILARQGQPAFRASLIQAYAGCCAISGSGILQILEAAHIVPYLGPHTNERSNGLLLRADVHTLFDRDLIRIDPGSLDIHLVESLRGSEYEEYHGNVLTIPDALSVEAVKANLHAREQLFCAGRT